jgi:hypothetical protein
MMERNFLLPLLIVCETASQAQKLHPAVTNILVKLGSGTAHQNVRAFAQKISNSEEIDRLFPNHLHWYPLLRSNLKAIHMKHP